MLLHMFASQNGGTRLAMHEGEVPIDLPLVGLLVADQFPRLADLPILPVRSTGTVNAIFRLGDDLYARLPRMRDLGRRSAPGVAVAPLSHRSARRCPFRCRWRWVGRTTRTPSPGPSTSGSKAVRTRMIWSMMSAAPPRTWLSSCRELRRIDTNGAPRCRTPAAPRTRCDHPRDDWLGRRRHRQRCRLGGLGPGFGGTSVGRDTGVDPHRSAAARTCWSATAASAR